MWKKVVLGSNRVFYVASTLDIKDCSPDVKQPMIMILHGLGGDAQDYAKNFTGLWLLIWSE